MAAEQRELLERLRKEKRLKELQEKQTGFGSPRVKDGQFQIGGNTLPVSEIAPSAAAVAENTLMLGSQMIAEPLAGLTGMGQAMNPFAEEGAGAAAVQKVRDWLTYTPKSKRAKASQAEFAEFIEPVTEVIDKARFGDETLEAGGPEWLAVVNELGPEILLSTVSLKPLVSTKPAIPKMRTNPQTGDVLPETNRLSPRIDLKVGADGKLVPITGTRQALKSGWAEKTVRWAGKQPKNVRDKLRRMIDSADDYYNNQEADTLPSDIIAEPAAQRLHFVDGVRSRAGRVMDAIAEGQLARSRVDIANLRSDLRLQIRKLGGEITPEGVRFGAKSKLPQGGDQNALIALNDKLNALGRMPTGKEVHDLKQWIDNYIKPRTSFTATGDSAVTEASQRVLEGTRRMANNTLRKISQPYAKANDVYRETRTAIDVLQKGAGNVDLFGDYSIENVGRAMRRVVSNAQAATNMKDGLKQVGKVAEKYSKGQLPYEDYLPEIRFLSEMEKLWGAFKEESLKGNLGQSAQRMVENPGVVQGMREMAGLTAKQIAKSAASREKQIQAMKRLLYQEGK